MLLKLIFHELCRNVSMKYRKLAADSIWNAIDYISTLLIFLVTTKILIDAFGAEGYGFYTFFTSLVGFFGMVDMGMGMAVSKYLCEFLNKKDYHRSSQIVNVAFFFYFIMASVILGLVLLFSESILVFLRFDLIYDGVGSVVLKLVAIVFLINLMLSIPTNILVALEEWVAISVINIVFKIVSALALVYILFLDVSESAAFVSIFSMVLLMSILKLISLLIFLNFKNFEYYFLIPGTEVRNRVASFLKFSSLQYFLSLLLGHLDKFIISRFFGLEALGIYSFCVQAFQYLYGMIVNALKVFYPKLSNFHGSDNRSELRSGFVRLLLLSSSLSLGAAVSMIAFWEILVSIYIDPEFAASSFHYIIYFAMFLVIRSPEVVMHYFFNATANPRMLVKNLMIGAPVTFTLYFFLVPLLGMEGLVVSQILGSMAVYMWHLYRFKTKGFDAHAL